MTYHRHFFTENVLKVRLSCVKPFWKKNRGKNQQKITVREKNQDRVRIYTPAVQLGWFGRGGTIIFFHKLIWTVEVE